MTEREICAAASERTDPAVRAAFLDEACGGDTDLRGRVEQLLRSPPGGTPGGPGPHTPAAGEIATRTLPPHANDPDYAETRPPDEAVADVELRKLFSPPQEEGSLGRLDHYEVLEVVGRGGMGVVLRAHDTKLRRVVAVKLLAPALAAVGTARRRFAREAQSAAAVRDEYVVKIHAVCEDAAVPYLVMEFVSGITLEDRVRAQGPLPVREVVRIGLQAARGLAAAHAQGLVHRDVKPGNILLEAGAGRVKLTDFGLARAADDASISRSGVIAGTPMYMSPEQAKGEHVDHRSDLFSLGSVLYTLCAGRPAFRAESTVAVLTRVCDDEPRPIREVNPDVPKWVCAVVAKLLAKDPAERVQTAAEVADLLGRYLAHLEDPDRAPPPPPVRGVRVTARSRVRRLAVAAVGLVAVIALGVVGYQAWRPTDTPEVAQPTSSVAPLADWRPPTAEELAARPSPLDGRTREQIPAGLLALAGGGPGAAPAELVAILGDVRFHLPKAGLHGWMAQDREGKLLAVPNADVVTLFDAKTGELIRTLTGHTGRVHMVAFSPDGKHLAGGNVYTDHTVKVWDVSTGRVIATLKGHSADICGIAFTPDGTGLVSHGLDAVKVWNLKTGEVRRTLKWKAPWSVQIGFSPDGARFVCGDEPARTARVIDTESGELLATLQGYSSEPRAAAYSADGKLLAVGSDKELLLWDAEKLEPVKKIETPAGWLAFEPDGKTILTAQHHPNLPLATDVVTRWSLTTYEGKALPRLSKGTGWPVYDLSPDGKTLYALIVHRLPDHQGERRVRAYDAATGKELFPQQGHAGQVWAVAASPDGRALASGGEDNVVRLWDLAGWKAGDPQPPSRVLTGHTGIVYSVAFSPDNKLVASKSLDGTLRLWDTATGESVRTIPTEAVKSASDVAFSPDGKIVAAGDDDGSVRLWDVATGEERSPLRWHNQRSGSLAFSPDNRFLASAGLDDRKVYVTDLQTMQRVQTLGPPGESPGQAEMKVAFGGDGRTLAYGGWDDTIHLRDLVENTETVLTGAPVGLDGLAVDPTGRFVAATRAGVVRFWDKRTPNRSLPIGPGPFGGIARQVAFTPEGRYLVVAGFNGTVSILRTPAPPPPYDPGPPRQLPDAADLATRPSPLDDLKPSDLPPGMVARLRDHRFRLPKVSQNSWMVQDREGKFLAVPNGDSVAIFDVRTAELVQTLTGSNRIYAVAFSPDGKFLAGGKWGGDHVIKVWELATGKATATLSGHTADIGAVAYTPDGNLLVSTASDGLKVWDPKAGIALRTLEAGGKLVWRIGVSPDGERVACGDTSTKTVRVFAPDTGALVATLSGHAAEVRAAAYSPDGKRLATCSDTELILWDAEKLELVKKIDTPAGWLAFTADGKSLLTATHFRPNPASHVVTRWDLTTFEGEPLPSLSNRPGETAFHLSTDGKTLYSLVINGPDHVGEQLVRTYDAATGRPLDRRGHAEQVWAVATSPDSTRLASAGDDGTVRLWDLASGKQLHVITRNGPAYSVAFGPDGKTLAAHWQNGPVVLFDPASGADLRTLAGDFAASEGKRMPYSPDGALLAAAGADGLVRVWDVASGRLRRTFLAGTDIATATAFSRDGKVIATGSQGGAVTLWDVASGWQVGTIPRQRGEGVTGIDFHPDGRSVAVAGLWRGGVLLPDGPTYAVTQTDGPNRGQAERFVSKTYTRQLQAGQQYRFEMTALDDKLAPLLVVDVEGDGKQVLSSRAPNPGPPLPAGSTALEFDGKSGGPVRVEVTVTPTRSVTCKVIACAEAGDGWFELRVHSGKGTTDWLGVGFTPVYDLTTGRLTHRLAGHDGGVRHCAWRADGKILVTAGDDGTVRAWDVAASPPGQLVIRTRPSGEARRMGMALTPGGRHVAATTPDGDIPVYRIPEPPPPYDPGPARPVPDPKELASRPAAADALRREDIPPGLLKHLGGGDPERVPPEVVAVLGDVRFRGPRSGPSSWMAMDREGKFLAVPCADSVAVYDARTGMLVRTLQGKGRMYSVAFSPDGKFLAGGSWETTSMVRVWDLNTGEVTATIASDWPTIWSLAFGPDGKRLVGSGEKELRVWDVATGKVAHSFAGSRLWQLALSPDGKRVAYPDADGKTARVANPETGEQVGTLEGFGDSIDATAFSPTGKWLATGNDRVVLLWDAETRKLVKKIDTPGGWLAFDPDGKTLLTAGHDQNGAGRDHVVTRWDLTTYEGKQLPPLSNLAGWAVFHLSPDGKTLYSMVADGQGKERRVRAHDAATGKELFPQEGHTGQVWSVAFSPDGKRLASVSSDPGVRLWDAATGKPERVLPHDQGFWSVAFSPDGKRIAAGEISGTVVLYDAATGKKLRTLPGVKTEVRAVAFSPDGSLVAGTTYAGVVNVWEAETGRPRHTLTGRYQDSWSVAFSPDSKTLATGWGWGSGEVVLSDVATGWEVGRLRDGVIAVRRLGFHPDGRSLGAVGSGWTSGENAVGADRISTCGVWDLKTWGQTRRTVERGRKVDQAGAPVREELGCTDAAWRADGLLMAMCGASDGTVRLWSTDGKPDRQQVIRLFPPGTEWLHGLAMSPEGRHLATANPDGTVTVLRLAGSGAVFDPVAVPSGD